MALKAQMRTLLAIRGHLLGHRHYDRWTSPKVIQSGVLELTKKGETLIAAMPWPDKRVDPFVWSIGQSPGMLNTATDLGSPTYLSRLNTDLNLLRRALSGRKRTEYRLNSAFQMRLVEQGRQEGKLRKVISTVLGSSHEHPPLSSVDLRPTTATVMTQGTDVTEDEVHLLLTSACSKVHDSLPHSSTSALHDGTLSWEDAQSWEKFQAAFPTLVIPGVPLYTFWKALTHPPGRSATSRDLEAALSTPPSKEAFKAALHRQSGETSGGPTGLTYRMMHHWPDATQDVAYTLLVNIWKAGQAPPWWRFKWVVPIPKKVANPTPADLRPIVLLETLRKTWTGLITGTIMNILQKNRSLCPSQHAFLRRKGTDTATLQLVNILETAHADNQQLFGSSWDIRKAFDTVSKALIRLAWLRLGVPSETVEWLLSLDNDACHVIRSDWALSLWASKGMEGISRADSAMSYNPERGIGQGDVSSPATWVAVFDIVLCALAEVESEEHSFLLSSSHGHYYAPDIAYADDLLSVARTLDGLQAKADMMSLCAILLGLTIAVKKLRTFYVGRPIPLVAPLHLTVHMDPWQPTQIDIASGGTLKSLGVVHDMDLSGKSQYALTTANLTQTVTALALSRASPACVLAALRSSTIAKLAYPAVLSSWSLNQLLEFDRILASTFRKISLNLRTSQLENLYQPASKGGQGFPRPSTTEKRPPGTDARRGSPLSYGR